MKVSVDGFRRGTGTGSILAFADILLDDTVIIRDVRLLNGRNGMFTAMPSRPDRDGKYRDIVRINDESLKDELTDLLVERYESDERYPTGKYR